jgi:hypothetical protein
MFEHASRYYSLDTAFHTTATGRKIAYKRRRFLPPAPSGPVMAEHTVAQTDRLDNITARYLGDPELFWRLCDDNDAMHPSELTAAIGRKLRIYLPEE